MTIDVLIACAQEDEDLRKELEKHLVWLRRPASEGAPARVRLWNPHSLAVGAGERTQEFSRQLGTTSLAILLSSGNFWDSDDRFEELQQVLKRRAEGNLRLLPLLARPAEINTDVSKLQALPRTGKPVDGGNSSPARRDDDWVQIAKEITAVVAEIEKNGTTRPGPGADEQARALLAMRTRPAAEPRAEASADQALTLHVRRTSPDWYNVEVSAPDGGSDGAALHPPLGKEYAALLATVPGRERHITGIPAGATSPPEWRLKLDAMARQVTAAVFPDAIRALFDRSLHALPEGAALRILLRLEADDDLALAVPWELLLRPGATDWLGTSRRTPIVREILLPNPHYRVPAAAPVRILVVLASPSDLGRIDIQGERKRIEDGLAPLVEQGLVHLEVLENPTFAAMQSRMTSQWHVLHFTGHGKNDGLYLCYEDGKADFLDSQNLTTLLAGGSLWLAVLNACDSAAQLPVRLLQSGLGAVVAMQHAISDDGALAFAKTLYEAIARGVSIEAAVADARMSLCRGIEVGIPALYLRSIRRTVVARD